MIHWLVSLIVTAALLLLVSKLIPGFEVASFGTALIAALVVGVANATLGVVLKLITFPLTIVTLGLFLLVINAFMLKIGSEVVPGFRIRGFAPAFWAALLLAIANALLGR